MKPPPVYSEDLAAIESGGGVAKSLAFLLALLSGTPATGAPSDGRSSNWPGYQIIMWQEQTPEQYRALKQLGITAASVPATRNDDGGKMVQDGRVEPLKEAGLRWYVENIATDFYAPYHKWSPDHPVNWRFLEVQKRYGENPLDRSAVIRDPSLSDPAWRAKIRKRLAATVAAQASDKPLYYSLGDETGIADLAAFWDFDFSQYSLAAMRDWLKVQYGTLAALNLQWGTHFNTWAEIVPMTTPEAMRRADGNYSAWADFKAWMDFAFANALEAGADAVHSADRGALAGIEGGQIPGWGGYDYARLASAVDVMEIYDNGANVELARSLNPTLVLLTTSFESGPKENHRIWRELLQGSRGLILWDENHDFVRDDGSPGPRGRDAASTFREIEGEIGPLLIKSARHYDPIAILYSQASLRTHWMLDWKDKGDAWSRRDAAAEYDETAFRSSMTGYLDAAEHLGFQPRFVSSEQLEDGELARGAYRVLILPHAIALSPAEAREIRRFVKQGGTIVADEEPGLFDAHSRRLERPLLADMFHGSMDGAAPSPAGFAVTFPHGRRRMNAAPNIEGLRPALAAAGLASIFKISRPAGEPATDVRTYIFRDGERTIVALHRDLLPGSPGDAREAIVLKLPYATSVRDLRRKAELGKLDSVVLDLDPYAPTILEIGGRAHSRPRG